MDVVRMHAQRAMCSTLNVVRMVLACNAFNTNCSTYASSTTYLIRHKLRLGTPRVFDLVSACLVSFHSSTRDVFDFVFHVSRVDTHRELCLVWYALRATHAMQTTR